MPVAERDVMATKRSTETPAKKATKTAAGKSPTKTAAKTAAETSASPASPEPAGARSSAEKREPTHAEISRLAHQYWEERGHHHGSHEADWARAERELRSRS